MAAHRYRQQTSKSSTRWAQRSQRYDILNIVTLHNLQIRRYPTFDNLRCYGPLENKTQIRFF